MSQKKKILRIRPFNMANFSSGAGFLAFSSISTSIAILPIMFVIWYGLASSIYTKENFLDYNILTKRANRIFLPICIAMFVLALIFISPDMLSYFGRNGYSFTQRLTTIWISAFPTLGMYVVVRLVLSASSVRLTASDLIKNTIIASIPLSIIGIVVSFLLATSTSSRSTFMGSSSAGIAIIAVLVVIGICAIWEKIKNRRR